MQWEEQYDSDSDKAYEDEKNGVYSGWVWSREMATATNACRLLWNHQKVFSIERNSDNINNTNIDPATSQCVQSLQMTVIFFIGLFVFLINI